MISSEVQRTLVKSPPELWTELSDPDSLARHLGALGEIRITRVEPETLVEWEAEGTTGAVHLKASGWGTKVTLTVSRELPEQDSEPARSEVTQPAAELAQDEETPQSTELAPAPDAEIASAGRESEPSPQQGRGGAAPGPATEAGRRAASWPDAPASPGPAIESDLRAAEDVPEPPTADAVEPSWISEQAPWEPEPEPGADSTLAQHCPEPSPESRRGFFARLFGGRRRAARAGGSAATEPTASVTAPDAPDGAIAEQPQDDTPVETVALTWEAPSDADPQEPEDEAPDVALERQEIAAPEQARHRVPEPDAPEAPEEPPALEAGTAPEAPERASDLGAELRAAEEVAAEEVRALLTAVLDRLGAAHHRPFSRA